MGSFNYNGTYPNVINYNGSDVTYLKKEETLVWIKPTTQLVYLNAAVSTTYTIPITAKYKLEAVGGGGGSLSVTAGLGGSGAYGHIDITLQRGTTLSLVCGGGATGGQTGGTSQIVINGTTYAAYGGAPGYEINDGGYDSSSTEHNGQGGTLANLYGNNGSSTGASVYGGNIGASGCTGMIKISCIGG